MIKSCDNPNVFLEIHTENFLSDKEIENMLKLYLVFSNF